MEEGAGAYLLGRDIFSEEGLNELSRKMKIQVEMNALWGTLQEVAFGNEYFAESGIESQSLQLQYGGKVHNLAHDNAGFTFKYEYSTAWIGDPTTYVAGKNISEIVWHGENLLKVKTSFLANINSMNAQEFKETLQELRKKKDNLWMKYAYQAGTGLISAFFPEVGLALMLGGNLVDGEAAKSGTNGIKLLDSLGFLDKDFVANYKSGALTGASAVGNWLDYGKAMEKLDKEISAEHLKQRYEWFGMGISFTAGGRTDTVNMGFYNPDTLKLLREWETNGLDSVLKNETNKENLRKEVINKLATQLEKSGDYNETVKVLLYGKGDILCMDMEEFVDGVEVINEAYKSVFGEDKKMPFGKELNIQSIFQMR